MLCMLILVLGQSCEEIEILDPPDNTGNVVQTSTGDSDALGIYFGLNETATLFVDPASSETYLVDDDVSKYFSNTSFARPSNVSVPNNLDLDQFPLLINEDFLDVVKTDPVFETTSYVGAFGSTMSEKWYSDSNWFNLDPQDVVYNFDKNTAVKVEGYIEQNTTWTKDKQYLILGQVFVKDGVTLTIEPGTVVFGNKGTGVEAGVLIFNRGSKINANGTPEEPIVFTGTADAGERTRGQWGGVVFLGRAPNNKGDDILIEGIQGDEADDGLFGGNDETDSSGTFSFWRVEYAGIAITPGNEVNSITYGSVGSGTTAHHILITAAGDDAMEWFGGKINMSYIATYNTLDDDLDMDSGFSGTLQYVYIVRNPYAADESGANAFEISSSDAVNTEPITRAQIANATVVGPLYQLDGTDLVYDRLINAGLSSNNDARAYIYNSIILGFPVGAQNP
ncbi:conserved hypothetical protein [Formosa agariphila KMM 3901]|uniref:Lipoprotein n=2 Tax=Formosa TaxID=225842 RepID=T2KMU6_FORAG|nr:conserved hypothetical protein [Formosa agariphila KMM 3901]